MEPILLALALLTVDEGFSATPYKCPAGYWTIGYGYRIENHTSDLRITQELAEIQTTQRLIELHKSFTRNRSVAYGSLEKYPLRQAVLLSMAYQLGPSGVYKFDDMWVAFNSEDLDLAITEMLDSNWAREDTPTRALRYAWMMEYNELHPAYKGAVPH